MQSNNFQIHGASVHPVVVDLSRITLRDALKIIHDTNALAECALALLAATQVLISKQPTQTSSASMRSRGLAVRTLLEKALDHIKPNDATIHIQDTAWRAYQAIYEHYVLGRAREAVEDMLHISRSELYRRLDKGMDAMLVYLRTLEGDAQSLLSADIANNRQHLIGQTISSAPPRVNAHEPLIGRESDMARIKASLNRHRGVVALHGMPGIGKTTLAVALGNDNDLLKHFPDGVLWASLGQSGNGLPSLYAWAHAVGVDVEAMNMAHTAGHIALLIQEVMIAQRLRMLFIVDDVWNLADALPFLTACRESMVLVVTRKPVIAGAIAETEHVIRLDELGETDSLTLLRQHAPYACRMCPSDALTLVEACAGLPLALVVAGHHLQVASHGNQERRVRSAFHALLQPEFRLSVPMLFDTPQRTGALQSTLAASDDNGAQGSGAQSGLDAASRAVWYALSSFMAKPMSMSEDAAVWVSEGTTDALDTLVDHGVLSALPGDRYALHPALAEYGRIKLQMEPAAYMRAIKRLVDYYLEWTWRYAEDDVVLERELAQVSQAMDLARQYGHHVEFVRIAHALASFLMRRGQDDDLTVLLEQAHTICLSLLGGAAEVYAAELTLLKARTALLLAKLALRAGRCQYAQSWCNDVLVQLPEGLSIDLAESARQLQQEIENHMQNRQMQMT